MKSMFRSVSAALLGLGVALAAGQASAAGFPDGPITMVVPFPPASVSDIVARLVAQEMSANIGQTIIVENRAGASGGIGAQYVAKAKPDGYTLLVGTVTTHGTNPGVIAKLPYDPIKDFAPVAEFALTPNVWVVNAKSPYKTLADLVAAAKAEPGKINYGSGGIGGGPFLCVELLKSMAGIDMTNISYKGSPETLVALLGDEIGVTVTSLTTSLPQIQAGTLRALGVTGPTRSELMPDVPTIAEAYPGYEFSSWTALFAPAATPADVVNTLNAEVAKALTNPTLVAKLREQGGQVVNRSPEELGTFVKAEIEKWTALMRKVGVQPQ
jgi:tripartite-type tricarboxylate transporter receptor subunit TctC